MTTSEQSGILARLRRYQKLVVFGGGFVITGVVLVASLLEDAASVDAYIARTKEEIAVDVRRSRDFITRATATLRNNVQNMVLAWDVLETEPSGAAGAFFADARIEKVQPNADLPPLLVMRANDREPVSDAWRYVRLAERMAAATAAVAARNAGELTVYLMSPDQRTLILAVLPWTGSDWQERVQSDPDGLLAALAIGDDMTTLSASGQWRDPATGARGLRWLPPYQSPLTGKASVRIAAELVGRNGRPIGTLVYELPLDQLAATLPENGLGGACAIIGPGGTLILSCSDSLEPGFTALAEQAVAAGVSASGHSVYIDGYLLSGWPLGPEGWTLVYAQTWRDIAAGVHSQIVVSALTSVLIIALTWMLLLTVKRRVFIPAVRQSQRIFESEQLSRTLIETAPVGLGLIAVDNGQSLLRSPVMADMAQRVKIDGPSLSFVLSRKYLQREARAGRAMLMQEDLEFPTRDGQHLDLAVSMARARYQGEDVLVAAFTDVTQKRNLERELQAARQAADAANAAKSAFLAAMSHEIRTPLNAILGNLEIMSHASLDALTRDRLKVVSRAADGLLAILNDVLDLSKIEAGELQIEFMEIDALEVASHALMMFAPVARAKGLTLVAELGVALCQPMRTDPSRVAQVIQNLLSNAIKFTDQGQVLLRLRRDAASDALLIDVEDTGIGMSSDQVARLFREFSQADVSIGRRFGGTGLGLALSQRLAHAMGGFLAAQSEPGKGSRFTLRLPLGGDADIIPEVPQFPGRRVILVAAAAVWRDVMASVLQVWGMQVETCAHPAVVGEGSLDGADVLLFWGDRQTWHPADENRLIEGAAWVLDCLEDGPAEPVVSGRVVSVSVFSLRGLVEALRHALQDQHLRPAAPKLPALEKPLRVLVAEDNSVNRKLFEEQLSMLGCEVTAVTNGEQALAQLQQHTFDVLLTDLSMPGMDGYTLAGHVRQCCPGLPVLAATANVTPQDRQRGLRAGMAAVLGKPLSLGKLAQALSEATGQAVVGNHPAVGATMPDNREGAENVRRIFLDACTTSVERLRQGLDDQDAAAVMAELHSLSGACAVFRLYSISERSAMLERVIRKDGLDACAAEVRALCDRVAALANRRPEDLRALADQIIDLSEGQRDQNKFAEIAEIARLLRSALHSGQQDPYG
ncbi:MAG: ATP-binding protein [Achromobacter sp.]|uniref:ATP-binding protein n=1 Tax=Achromobacter sp. TaxID=134375 RepID=UPI003D01C5FC